MSDLSIYREEIFNFINTLTIKFERLAEIKNEQAPYIIDTEDKTTWPYYLNLAGEYHQNDEMMYVTSVDTEKQIEFTKANLVLHPKTAHVYRPGNVEYEELCKKYPEQNDLIKSIVYPVENIQDAIDAEDFTLLNYDDTYLHVNERYDIVECVRNFIKYTVERWYLPSYEIEAFYPIAYWALFWQNLALAIFTRRVENIKTSNVHPLHIWEYLVSKGIDDCRDILTNEQALFLYKNINYIFKNKGKQSTLIILADNLLKKLKIRLMGKDIYHNTLDQDIGIWHSEFKGKQIADYTNDTTFAYDKLESVKEINERLFLQDDVDRHDERRVNFLQDKLDHTTKGILPTKIVELKKFFLDHKYENIFLRFVIDTFTQKLADGKLNYSINFTDNVTHTEVEKLHVSDAYVLMSYVASKIGGVTPTHLPSLHIAVTGYKHHRPIKLNKYFFYKGKKYNAEHILPLDFMCCIPYTEDILNKEELKEVIFKQFTVYLNQYRFLHSEADMISHVAIKHIYGQLTPKRIIELDYSKYANFDHWFTENPRLKRIIEAYEVSKHPEHFYRILFNKLLRNVLLLDDICFDDVISMEDEEFTDRLYSGLKKLFTQLISYDITFLDTVRDKFIFLFTRELVYDMFSERESSVDLEVSVGDVSLINIINKHDEYFNHHVGEQVELTNHVMEKEIVLDDSIGMKINKSYDSLLSFKEPNTEIGISNTKEDKGFVLDIDVDFGFQYKKI